MLGRNVWLINMMGQVVHRWKMENVPGNYGKLLKNGNLLYAGKLMPSPLPQFGGNGGQLIERSSHVVGSRRFGRQRLNGCGDDGQRDAKNGVEAGVFIAQVAGLQVEGGHHRAGRT